MEQNVFSCSAVCSFAPHLQAAVGATRHLCIVERNSPASVRKCLNLTHAGLGKDITYGVELTSARSVYLPLYVLFVIRTLCHICLFIV